MRGIDIFAIWRLDGRKVIIYGVFDIMAVQLTYFMVVKESNAATATVSQYLSPVITAVVTAAMLRKLLSGRILAAIILAFAGTFFAVTHGSIKTLSISAVAVAWGIASAFITAFHVMCSLDIV